MESKCGLICSTCEWKEKTGCKGCIESKGKPFHGTCEVAMCCISKEHKHCGMCNNFPCDVLNEFAYDKEHGDNGLRIENLRIWAKENKN